MKYILFGLILLFSCLATAPLFYIRHLQEKIEVVEPQMTEKAVKFRWACHDVVDCKTVDWRYYKPKDVCTYEDTIVYSPENPVENESYGAYCIKT